MIESKKRYVLTVYIGSGRGILHRLKEYYWTWRLNHMRDGEILDRYYRLTRKEPEDYFIRVKEGETE